MRRLLTMAVTTIMATTMACGSSGGESADTVETDTPSDTGSGDADTTADTTADTEPTTLSVVSTVPTDASVVSPTDPIVITFDQAVDPASLDDTTFVLTGDGSQVFGTHEVAGAVYTFTPSSPLLGDTDYAVTLSTGVMAAGGGPALEAPVTFGFVTIAGMHVVSVEPEDGAEKVGTSSAIRVTFDRPITSASVTPETFQVVTSGWVDGVYYDGEPLPGNVRILDEDGITVDEGTTIQWYVDTQALPEYEVRHSVTVTRGVKAADGAVLDAPFQSEFQTVLLSADFYYSLHVDGFGADRALGVDSSGNLAEMTEFTIADGFGWYFVYLNDGKSLGVWNRGTAKALRENGANSGATLETWQGIFQQGFQLESYGGTSGATAPYQSPRLYYLKSNGAADNECMKAETATNGKAALFVRPQGGNIYSLWYFIRGERK